MKTISVQITEVIEKSNKYETTLTDLAQYIQIALDTCSLASMKDDVCYQTKFKVNYDSVKIVEVEEGGKTK